MSQDRLQLLYNACKETFVPGREHGPSSQGVLNVKSIVDTITLSDLGLSEDVLLQQDRDSGLLETLTGWRDVRTSMVAWWSPPISYRHIYDSKNFSMGIFVLPQSAVIPLHDHPGMTVISKLLCGSMRVKSYDWVDPLIERQEAGQTSSKLAKVTMDRVIMAPCESSVLFPRSGGNIHAIKGLSFCALLDVLAPPYSQDKERNITYYRSFPLSTFPIGDGSVNLDGDHHRKFSWLREFQLLDGVVRPAPYEPPNLEL